MSIEIIQERLEFYQCRSELEEEHALREISQEIVLAALSRADFFKHSIFQGGTCLRIFYSLNRFSEDLDFILKEPDTDFQLKAYFNDLKKELGAFGYNLEIEDRSKATSAIKKAFLKDNSLGKVLNLSYLRADRSMKKIRIKLEIDTNPPAKNQCEVKFHEFPFAFSAAIQDLPSLFAGKMHALLCREYIKGRDWYDFIWYVSRKAQINYAFLTAAMEQNGPWEGENLNIDKNWCMVEMQNKIESIDWDKAKQDIQRFIKPEELPSINLWGKDFFFQLLKKL